MAIVSGIVEYKAPNKFGGYSIKVNGGFYNSKFEPKCEKGDNVSFDDGGKKYINDLKVVLGGAVTPPTAPAGKAGYRQNGMEGGFPVHPGAYERALDRRNAIAAAVALATSPASGLLAVNAEDVIGIARKFEAYTTGDLERVKVEQMFNSLSGDD